MLDLPVLRYQLESFAYDFVAVYLQRGVHGWYIATDAHSRWNAEVGAFIVAWGDSDDYACYATPEDAYAAWCEHAPLCTECGRRVVGYEVEYHLEIHQRQAAKKAAV